MFECTAHFTYPGYVPHNHCTGPLVRYDQKMKFGLQVDGDTWTFGWFEFVCVNQVANYSVGIIFQPTKPFLCLLRLIQITPCRFVLLLLCHTWTVMLIKISGINSPMNIVTLSTFGKLFLVSMNVYYSSCSSDLHTQIPSRSFMLSVSDDTMLAYLVMTVFVWWNHSNSQITAHVNRTLTGAITGQVL